MVYLAGAAGIVGLLSVIWFVGWIIGPPSVRVPSTELVVYVPPVDLLDLPTSGFAYRTGQALGIGALGLGAAAFMAGGPAVWALTIVVMLAAKK